MRFAFKYFSKWMPRMGRYYKWDKILINIETEWEASADSLFHSIYFMYIWKFLKDFLKVLFFAKKSVSYQGSCYWVPVGDKTHIAIKQLKSQSREKRSQLSKISPSVTKYVWDENITRYCTGWQILVSKILTREKQTL